MGPRDEVVIDDIVTTALASPDEGFVPATLGSDVGRDARARRSASVSPSRNCMTRKSTS
jgi:hypothetical protein